MANCSIPNSIPAIGRTSTPLSRRSRKQSSGFSWFSAASILAHVIALWPLGFGNSQRPTPGAQRPIQTLDIEHWTFFFRRVKGAWWSSRSSKPLSVPPTRDRGRFDSYPLRQISVAASVCRGAQISLIHGDRAPWLRGFHKGGEPYVA